MQNLELALRLLPQPLQNLGLAAGAAAGGAAGAKDAAAGGRVGAGCGRAGCDLAACAPSDDGPLAFLSRCSNSTLGVIPMRAANAAVESRTRPLATPSKKSKHANNATKNKKKEERRKKREERGKQEERKKEDEEEIGDVI